MLVTRRADHLVLITQPEHARLAGRLATSWGHERFAIPAARKALILAATHHDDGWYELDGLPAYSEDAARPAAFVELPPRQTVGPYARGVESVYARDPHAGALVGMHFSGFYTGRWGLTSGSPSTHPITEEVVATQEARWMPALRQAWGYLGPRSEFDAVTWHAYEVLQALDLISLALGLTDLEQPSAPREPLTVTSTLRLIDQPPGPRIIEAVPVTAGGERANLRLDVVEPGRVQLHPYPFAETELKLTLATRRLEDRAYPSAAEAAAAFHAAPVTELRFTLGPVPGA